MPTWSFKKMYCSAYNKKVNEQFVSTMLKIFFQRKFNVIRMDARSQNAQLSLLNSYLPEMTSGAA